MTYAFFSHPHLVSQNLNDIEAGNIIPPGIWTLADVQQYGVDNGTCPYFTIRRMVLYSSHAQ